MVQLVLSGKLCNHINFFSFKNVIFRVSLGLCGDELIVNPTRRELLSSSLDLVVTATKQNLVVMLEGKGNVVLQQDLLKAIKLGTKEAQSVIAGIEKLQKSIGKTKKEFEVCAAPKEMIIEAVTTFSEMRLREVFRDAEHDKFSRDHAVNDIRTDVINRVWSSYPDEDPGLIGEAFNIICKKIFRDLIFEEEKRCDGRTLDCLRNISCQVGIVCHLLDCSSIQN